MLQKKRSDQAIPNQKNHAGADDQSALRDNSASRQDLPDNEQMLAGQKIDPTNGEFSQDDSAQTQADQLDLAQLSEALASCQTALTQAQDARNRALADYQNLQRRTVADRQTMAKLATQSLVEELLPHFDHLSMALDHNQDKGLAMIVGQLWQTLNDHGVAEIQAVGKPFDPMYMEAVQSPEEDKQSTSEKLSTPLVKTVHQRGYTLNGVVLRVAKVSF